MSAAVLLLMLKQITIVGSGSGQLLLLNFSPKMKFGFFGS